MSSLFAMAAFYGLKDSINPGALTMLFCFLFMVAELRRRRVQASWYAALFCVTVFVASLFLAVGILMPILYSDQFFDFSGRVYVLGGIVLSACGAIHLRDWWQIKRAGDKAQLFFPLVTDGHEEPEGRPDKRVIFGVMLLSFALSALNTIWPPSEYISFYTNFIYMPGKRMETCGMLLIYHFVRVLLMVGVFVFVSSNKFSSLVKTAPSMVKIVLSALTVSLGVSILYIFH